MTTHRGVSRGGRRRYRTGGAAALICAGTLGLAACGGGADEAGGPRTTRPPHTATAESAPPTGPSATPTESPSPSASVTPTAAESPADDTATDDSEGSSSGVPHGKWNGTAHITVSSSDPGCAAGSRAYDLPATLLITSPVGAERNAFHLSWGSDSQAAEGAFGVTSALSGTDTRDGASVETGYWSLSDDGDGHLSGRLTDTAAAQGASLNLLFVPKPILPCSDYMAFPYAMARGTTLDGTVRGDSASLTLSGTSTDGTRSFRVTWS
ncbi:hypothetical protein [Streptomyces kronopolitis]|uniref:hypothetical protein n=1 Tax=Streptomyces kronopolitis TaxID=1612435 RepID=UPI0034335B77